MDDYYHSGVRIDVMPFVPAGERLLDVGGGFGGTAKALKREGKVKAIGVWDAVAPESDPQIDVAVRADLNDVDAVAAFFAEHGSFDVILFLDVLEHLVDPWTVLATFAKHVPPGGSIVSSIPNVRHISVSGKLLFGNRWTYTEAGLLDRTHLRFFVRDTAIEIMTLDGFTIRSVAMSPIGSRLYKLINAVTLNQFRSLFSNQYIIVATRNA
jgi:2-polyprenyl-3-methyl-5-hydroxy-6-metoxy-1,4-benzoquinol methylase